MTESRFTHVNSTGRLRMVDVSGKEVTRRIAVARCLVVTSVNIDHLIVRDDEVDPVLFARVTGITAAKRTSDLIPLCHSLNLDDVDVALVHHERGIEVNATVTATQRTGVEMEALSACAFAALSILDTLQSQDPLARIEELELLKKEGGRSGAWGRLGVTNDADPFAQPQ